MAAAASRSGAEQPQWPGSRGPQTPGSATAALIIGICCLVVCWPIGGPLAVIYGNKAKNEIERSSGSLTGSGLATAGHHHGLDRRSR